MPGADAMTFRLLTTFIKILVASLLVGVALSSLSITPEQILKDLGLTPEQIVSYINRGFHWALPHIILGGLVTVPIWLVMYILRPPRGD
ncbi:MAG: DUF6460 domain-containing protein [Hyphomicrobiales bacterium]|nr:DUF6460 domain-containing protein [Hyphomicrobiales bacterium]